MGTPAIKLTLILLKNFFLDYQFTNQPHQTISKTGKTLKKLDWKTEIEPLPNSAIFDFDRLEKLFPTEITM
jgi:hypothetical protein